MPELLLMFFTTGAINSVYGMIAISFFIIVPWQMMKTGRAYVNGMASVPFYALAIFGFLYVLIGEFSIQGFFYYLICPLLAYLAGWVTIESAGVKAEDAIRKAITAIFLGYVVHAFFNYSINIGHQRWELNDFFSGSFRGATGSGCINTLVLSLAAYIATLEEKKIKKILGLACVVVSLLYAFLLGTRTQFIIFLTVNLVFLVCFLYEKYGLKSAGILIGIVLVVVGVCFYLYTNNVFGIKLYVDSSNLMARYTMDSGLQTADDYRKTSITRGIDNLFSYPLGGLKGSSYYHNFWLDIGRVAGILPFICMAFYSVVINIHAVRILKKTDLASWFRYLIMCVYLGMQINFMVEPILEGLLDFFLVFTVINGMLECYYQRYFFRRKMR